jgi:hypothetical protein
MGSFSSILTGILPTFYRKVMRGWHLREVAHGGKTEGGRTPGPSPGDNGVINSGLEVEEIIAALKEGTGSQWPSRSSRPLLRCWKKHHRDLARPFGPLSKRGPFSLRKIAVYVIRGANN